MTLGDCLEEIRRVYLAGDHDAMVQVGIGVIKKVKEVGRWANELIPHHGWLVDLRCDGPFIIHKKLRIKVKIHQHESRSFVDTECPKEGSILE